MLTILYVMGTWWRDIIREGTFEGQHTEMVQTGLRSGMILFIVSEVIPLNSALYFVELVPISPKNGLFETLTINELLDNPDPEPCDTILTVGTVIYPSPGFVIITPVTFPLVVFTIHVPVAV